MARLFVAKEVLDPPRVQLGSNMSPAAKAKGFDFRPHGFEPPVNLARLPRIAIDDSETPRELLSLRHGVREIRQPAAPLQRYNLTGGTAQIKSPPTVALCALESYPGRILIRNGRENGLTFVQYARYQNMLGLALEGFAPMHAYLSNNQNRENIFDPPPVLIAAEADRAKARARQTIAMAGLRIADVVGIADAPARIAQQVTASALWVEIEAHDGPATDALLDAISAEVSNGRYPAIVAAPAELLDRLSNHAFDPGIELILDADESERTAALAVALSGARRPERLSDVSADKNAARLRQLSEEVNRIASTLARLSTGPASPPPAPVEVASEDLPPISVDMVRTVIRARRIRSRYFSEHLFADPAWDMLLDLLQAEISHLRVPVSSLCIAAAVPATTALRWLKTMVQEGLFVRRADPHDGRRVFVELAPETSAALRRYFAEVGKIAAI